MGFGKGKWLKVWEITKREENFTEARVSSSKKNRDGEYETDFNGFVRFIGDAHKAAKEMDDGDRIRIQACETTNFYDKGKDRTYWNCAIFKFDHGDEEAEKEDNNTSATDVDDNGEQPLPW